MSEQDPEERIQELEEEVERLINERDTQRALAELRQDKINALKQNINLAISLLQSTIENL